MAGLQSLVSKNKPKPPIILIYGPAGCGKTTFASQSKKPVVILTEDGLGTLEVPHFPIARRFEDVLEAFGSLYAEPHEFSTVVVDSTDWLETLIQEKTCRDNGWKNIEEPGYGKGYVMALALWRNYLDALTALRDERGMTVIQVGHADIKRFDSPEHDPYDRYIVKLHNRAGALVQEHADVVLFSNYRVSMVKSDVGFGKKVSRALGSGERVIYTSERPAFVAKNRYALPDTLALEWSAFAGAMPPSLHPMLIT